MYVFSDEPQRHFSGAAAARTVQMISPTHRATRTTAIENTKNSIACSPELCMFILLFFPSAPLHFARWQLSPAVARRERFFLRAMRGVDRPRDAPFSLENLEKMMISFWNSVEPPRAA